MELNQVIPRKNIILLIGPSCSGKSTLSQRLVDNLYVNHQDGDNLVSSCVLSSDAIRRELMMPNYDENETNFYLIDSRRSSRMMEVSNQAFKLLEAQLINRIEFPVNTDYIIIDSTALNSQFRDRILEIAKQYQYHVTGVVIDLPRSDLTKFAERTQSKNVELSMKHLDRLKKDVLPNLNRRKYDNFFTINSLDKLTNFMLHPNLDTYKVFPKNRPVAFIGDVHEQSKAFWKLISILNDKGIENEDIFMVGDYLDKNNNTREIVEMVYQFMFAGKGKVIKANHENYVYKRLFSDLKDDHSIDEKFSSLKVLQSDPELAWKFKQIFENSAPYYEVVRDKGNRIFVTHAICQNKYIGKTDQISQREQRNFRYTGYTQEQLHEKLDYLEDESSNILPIHVFGHISNFSVTTYKNKINIDTSGSKLSAITFDQENPNKFGVIQVEGIEQEKKYMSWVPQQKKENLVLEPYQETFARRFIESGAKYISGTMAPSKATLDPLNIESLEEAFRQFKGCPNVVIQPKFMGSRAQIYLFKNDLSKCFATSRNGFKIKQEGIESIIKTVHDKYDSLYTESMILDGELLPWSFLGKGLIEQTYEPISEVLKQKYQFFNDVKYKELGGIAPSEAEHLVFEKQLELYGKDTTPEYKAFSILAIDGEEVYSKRSQYNDYALLNGEQNLSMVNQDCFSEFKNNILELFNKLTVDQGFEGIVIKPDYYDSKYPPYLKVRNPKYLTLIYGADYLTHLPKLCKIKKTDYKNKIAKKECELGLSMLRCKDDETLKSLLVQMLGQLDKEKELDPRL